MGQDLPLGPLPGPLLGPFLGLALLVGCAPPVLRQAGPAELQAEWLAFLVDGKTTREDVLLRLGTPSAHLEGERILTYAFMRHRTGVWGPVGRRWEPTQRSFVYSGPHLGSLVLVFAGDGRLVRHSFVVSQ